jgi:hypothetical protein
MRGVCGQNHRIAARAGPGGVPSFLARSKVLERVRCARMERLKLNLSSVGLFMQEVDDYVSCMDFLFEVFLDVGCGWYVRGRELEGTVEGRIGVYAA